MLHSFKKNFAKATAPTRGINPGAEFLDYKSRLSTIKKNLQYVDRKMEDALKTWNSQMIEQRTFSQRFADGYPIRGDETDAVVKEFAHGSQNVYDHFMRSSDPESETYRNMHAQVKAYIVEISNVEALYSGLKLAKSEAERYQAKVDAIDSRGKSNDLKRSRNLQKMDHEKLKLKETEKIVVNAQKQAYTKAPTIYKAALCSYWSAHERQADVMSKTMEKTSLFTRKTVEELANLDISQMLLAEEMTDGEQTGDEMTASSEIESLGVHDRAFAKVPSVMPDSPQPNSEHGEETKVDVNMEVEAGVQEPIAI